MRLKDKVALVTGAAQGIGAAIAQRFAREGAQVFVCDLKEVEGSAFAEALRADGGRARFLRLDVTDEASWVRALAVVVDGAGRLDVLVNNAGINVRKPIEEMRAEEIDLMRPSTCAGPFWASSTLCRFCAGAAGAASSPWGRSAA